MSDSFILLIPEAHPLARAKAPLRWADIAGAEHLTTIVAMMECGFGVAASPEIAAGAVAQTGIVQRRLSAPVAERSIGLVTARNRRLSPAAVALVQTLREYVAAQAR